MCTLRSKAAVHFIATDAAQKKTVWGERERERVRERETERERECVCVCVSMASGDGTPGVRSPKEVCMCVRVRQNRICFAIGVLQTLAFACDETPDSRTIIGRAS